MSMKDKIKALAREQQSDLVKLRRHLHANPELSFEESETAAYMKKRLQEAGITITDENIADNGFVALIEGRNADSSMRVFRAEMDALPIVEKSDAEYKSSKEGIMHACGHDVHMSCVFGAATILNSLKEEWEGSMKILFQPAEEMLPGGASLMIEQGVLEKTKPDAIIGMHVMPEMEAGTVGFKAGQYMASSDEIYLTITAKGGHAAMTTQRVDSVLVAAKIRIALEEVPSKHDSPCVLAFGKFIAQGATNVIPDQVHLEGTLRTMDENWREEAHALIRKIASELALEMDAKCEVEIKKGYPSLINDDKLTKLYRDSAIKYLDESHVEELPLRMTSDDFAYYSQIAPSCYFRLGVGNQAKGINAPVHNPSFDIDETALEIGAGMLAWLAVQPVNQ